MRITASEIIQRAQALWPSLEQIWCFDQEYECPTEEEVCVFAAQNPLRLSEITALDADCDDFALQYHAQVKRDRNWSFGEAFTDRFSGFRTLHNLNICVCREGIVLLDPRTRTVRRASPVLDNVLWMRI